MRIKLSFEGKEIKPDDVVIVRPRELISAREAQNVSNMVQKAFPDNHTIILPPDYYLETMDKDIYKNFLEHQLELVNQR